MINSVRATASMLSIGIIPSLTWKMQNEFESIFAYISHFLKGKAQHPINISRHELLDTHIQSEAARYPGCRTHRDIVLLDALI